MKKRGEKLQQHFPAITARTFLAADASFGCPKIRGNCNVHVRKALMQTTPFFPFDDEIGLIRAPLQASPSRRHSSNWPAGFSRSAARGDGEVGSVVREAIASCFRGELRRKLHCTRERKLPRVSTQLPSRQAAGPAITFSAAIPDLHHYNGRGGRVFPLWRDAEATTPNLPPKLLEFLAASYKTPVTAEDFFAYLAGVAANPAYTARFQARPGPTRLAHPHHGPSRNLFAKAVNAGPAGDLAAHVRRAFCRREGGSPAGAAASAEGASAAHPQGRRDPGRSRFHAR